jgi:hypothetical protein
MPFEAAAGGFLFEIRQHLLHQTAQRRGMPPQFLPPNARQVEQVIH